MLELIRCRVLKKLAAWCTKKTYFQDPFSAFYYSTDSYFLAVINDELS